MSDISKIAQWDVLRSVNYTSISGTYVAIGTPISYPARLPTITNLTDANMIFSDDGINDKFIVPANSGRIIDIGANRTNLSGSLDAPRYTRFYVRQESAAPTTGNVYLDMMYAYDNQD